METVRVGIIGIGCRGGDILPTVIFTNEKVRLTAVCDL